MATSPPQAIAFRIENNADSGERSSPMYDANNGTTDRTMNGASATTITRLYETGPEWFAYGRNLLGHTPNTVADVSPKRGNART